MKILIHPFGSKNPYQELLYSPFHLKGHRIAYSNKIANKEIRLRYILPIFPVILLFYRIRGFKIFHLHWTEFSIPNKNKKEWIFNLNFKLTKFYIKLIKFLGFNLIWTIHNLVPHERKTSNDLEITSTLCNLADAKIAHSKETISEMKKLKLNTTNTFIIPHGSYIGVYPNCSKDTRSQFGFSKRNFIFLYIGIIRRYKGIPELLNTFSRIKSKSIRLIVAGNCGDIQSERLLNKYSQLDKRIVFKKGFIKDEEIQKYMNASDVVVYPFRRITTSGSVILASSFGKPIIYPLIGGLKEIPKNIGFSYDPQKKLGLLNCMKRSIKKKSKLNKIGKSSFKYAKGLSWKKIAKKTLIVYNSISPNY